jgi:lipoprotein-anchoring transpeptidase ErfK/SrfK
MRAARVFVAALAATVALAAGCDAGTPKRAAPASAVPSASTPAPATPPAAPARPAPAKPAKLRVGARGPGVAALQRRLSALGYWGGAADGSFGSLTQQAVFALQKAAGLDRDGVVGPRTRAALDQGVRPAARSGSGHVVEVDLKRQLLKLVDDGRVTAVFNTSTGSLRHYEFQGETRLAVTPDGHFRVSRQVDAWDDGPLGRLYRPKYFNGGIAVHGASSVPPYPASHGCARVSVPAMDWLWTAGRLPLGTAVWVY